MNPSSKINKWTVENSFDKKAGSVTPPQWPHEALVKVFSSKAYSNLTQDIIPLNQSIKVIEIGCMGGNNLRFFAEKGCSVSGVEVTEDLVNLSKIKCKHYGIENIDIFCGNNQSIPLDDSGMDVLVSVNTLHYEQGAKNINNALENFSRVLRPGGWHLLRRWHLNILYIKKLLSLRTFVLGQIMMILERMIYSDFSRALFSLKTHYKIISQKWRLLPFLSFTKMFLCSFMWV